MSATTPLPRSTPRAEGVSAEGLGSFLDALAAGGLEMHSLMLLRHGRVVAEGWWRPYAAPLRHSLFSLSKSFASTAIGLAVAEGRLTVDDPVLEFFPGDGPEDPGPHLAALRVRHLLTMGTGHDQDTTGRMQDPGRGTWVRGFLGLDIEHEPGSKFVYNSGATYMLSAILQRVTGSTLLDYLTPRLLQPLGIEGATWQTSPQGIAVGGWGLSITTEDIARFGQLYLQEGNWEGRQLVPRAWVAEATSAQISNAAHGQGDWAQGYGYQFWHCRHGAYRGDGAHGQFCVVLPAEDSVLAMTAGTDRLQAVLDCVWGHVLPALRGGGGDDAALAARLAGLTLAPPAGAPRTGEPCSVRLAPNEARLEAVDLERTPEGCRLVLAQGGRQRSVPCGVGTWRQGEASRDGGPAEPCAGHASWEADGGLRLDWRFICTPFGGTLRIAPDRGSVHYRSNLGAHAAGLTIPVV